MVTESVAFIINLLDIVRRFEPATNESGASTLPSRYVLSLMRIISSVVKASKICRPFKLLHIILPVFNLLS